MSEVETKVYQSFKGEGLKLQMNYAGGMEVRFVKGYYETSKKAEQDAIEKSTYFKKGKIVIVPKGAKKAQDMMTTGVITSSSKAVAQEEQKPPSQPESELEQVKDKGPQMNEFVGEDGDVKNAKGDPESVTDEPPVVAAEEDSESPEPGKKSSDKKKK